MIIKESSVAPWQDDIMRKVYNALRNDHIGGDVYDDYNFRSSKSFLMCVEIEWGDWKHDHADANYVVNDILNDLGNEYSSQYMGEEVTEEDGSDTYSAIHKWFITKDSVTESIKESELYTSEETGSYTVNDSKEAAIQVFANAFKLFNKGITESEFQMDEELDTETFWRTFARKCTENYFEYYIVHKDNNFDEVYYTIELIDIAEPEDFDECTSINESVYTDNGFANRREYLQSLADDYGVSLSDVQALASVLGPEEDFDALVTEVEDLAYSQEAEKDVYLPFDKELEYKLKNYPYVVVDPDRNEYNWTTIGYTNYQEAADEVILYLLDYESLVELYTVRNHTKETYDPAKLDVSKLSVGDSTLSFIGDDIDRYVDIYTVGKRATEENIRDILDMCKVSTEKF